MRKASTAAGKTSPTSRSKANHQDLWRIWEGVKGVLKHIFGYGRCDARCDCKTGWKYRSATDMSAGITSDELMVLLTRVGNVEDATSERLRIFIERRSNVEVTDRVYNIGAD